MKTFKALSPLVLIVSLISHGTRPVLAAIHHDEQLTDNEKQQAREIATQFTSRFVETADLNLLVKDLYRSDFIERFKRGKSKELGGKSATHLYFVPGLDYNSSLLTDASDEDWRRFYIATNNFLFFGFVSGVKEYSRNSKDLKATDLYPPTVIKLLDSNPNLANMIERKGKSRAVGSVEEMRQATVTLEQAAAILRKKQNGKPLGSINARELARLMKEDELFRPRLEIVRDESFGFPQGTRFVFINTPFLFRLILVESDGDLKILSAEYVVD